MDVHIDDATPNRHNIGRIDVDAVLVTGVPDSCVEICVDADLWSGATAWAFNSQVTQEWSQLYWSKKGGFGAPL